MGKKKSVVFMTLITIVLLVLCAVVAFPAIKLDANGIKKWNPAVMQYDLGAEFSGGHYAYYYPEGIISETEYNSNLDMLPEGEKADYVKSYKKFASLYMSTDVDDCILDENGNVTEGFKTAFGKTVALLNERFEERAAKTGSTYRLSVVDNYAIRVDISASENTEELTSESYVFQAFQLLANTGELGMYETKEAGTELVDALHDEDASITDLIKRISVKDQYEIAYIKIQFTSKGKEIIENFRSSEDITALSFKVGDSELLKIEKSNIDNVINTKNEILYGVRYDSENLYADTLCVLLNSAMEKGGVYINENEEAPLQLTAPTQADIRTYDAVDGELWGLDTLLWVYFAALAIILFVAIFGIIRMGGFGAMNLYTTLSYFAIVAFCYAFISKGVFVVSLSSILVFLVGLVLTNVLNAYICKAIKKEAKQGKTIVSSVKSGYKKTIWTVVDVYAVLLLGALSMLIGVASLHTLAVQAIICIFTAAFVNLLLGRAINYMLLSAHKDKYKYFRLVREDDDDE